MRVAFSNAALAASDSFVAARRGPDEIATVVGESDNLLAVRLDVMSAQTPRRQRRQP